MNLQTFPLLGLDNRFLVKRKPIKKNRITAKTVGTMCKVANGFN